MIYTKVESLYQDVLDEAELKWANAQDECCDCPSGHPPCSFCVDGFSLDLDEYLELYVEQPTIRIGMK